MKKQTPRKENFFPFAECKNAVFLDFNAIMVTRHQIRLEKVGIIGKLQNRRESGFPVLPEKNCRHGGRTHIEMGRENIIRYIQNAAQKEHPKALVRKERHALAVLLL